MKCTATATVTSKAESLAGYIEENHLSSCQNVNTPMNYCYLQFHLRNCII